MDPSQVDTLLRFGQLSTFIIILYDHVCNIDAEVKYVWRKPWTVSKTLFITQITDLDALHRRFAYSPPIVHCISDTTRLSQLVCICITFIAVPEPLFYSSVFLSLLRSTYTILVTFVSELLVAVAKMINIQFNFVANYVKRRTTPLEYFGVGTAFKTILLSFTIRKFISYARHAPASRRLYLNRLIITDSIAYYIISLVVYSIFAVIWLINPLKSSGNIVAKQRLDMMVVCILPAYSTTISCRLILCLLRAHEEDFNRRDDVRTSDVQVTSLRAGDGGGHDET
ncbi:hypothetical protein BDQ17DRAFT_1327740 [Cyathus striatus]|nr:hypothetical protein BDQ17DRAFT_1327740 [Cyathus striatus]